jgi:adenylate kinase
MKIIAVLGISGVGKSNLVEKAAQQRNLLHLKASDLIKARLAWPQSSEQLRQGTVLDNQAHMLAEFADRIAATDHNIIVFDGHGLIDSPGGLVEIPLSVFRAIQPNAIVFVEDVPAVIATRRTADTDRVRPARSVIELAQQQSLAKVRAAYFAQSLGVPSHAITAADTTGFVALLD